MIKIEAKNGEDDSTIHVDAWDYDTILITQEDGRVFVQDEKQARRLLKVVRKFAKELGWEV